MELVDVARTGADNGDRVVAGARNGAIDEGYTWIYR